MKKENLTFNQKKYFDLVQMEQSELHYYLKGKLNSVFDAEKTFESKGEYIYYEGDIPVLLLAHLDTVHKVKPSLEDIFYDKEKNVIWSPLGIGADDRNGVYSILEILEQGYKPHVLFSWDEEIGCVGSSAFSTSVDTIFGEKILDSLSAINFAIQFDRKGFSEAVYYNLDNLEFEEYINSFGFKTEEGSFTDICEICPAFGFAGVNISTGYLDEHTSEERCYVDEMLSSIEKVINILEEEPPFFKYAEKNFYFTQRFDESTNYGYMTSDFFYSSIEDDSTRMPKGEFCEWCLLSKETVPWDDDYRNETEKRLCNLCRENRRLDEEGAF